VVLFLNPDTELVGHAINELYRQLQRLPVDAIVGPTLLNSDGSVQDTCIRAFPTILNQVLDSDLLRTRFPRARLWGKSALLDNGSLPHRVDAVSGACLMMQRSAFEAIGMFSTEYFMYAEDMDLCLKAGRLGFPCYFAPKAVVVHHGGGSSSQAPANKFSSVMALESQWRFFRKTRSDGYANLYRVAMCLASLLRLGILLLAWPLQKLRAREQSTGNALRKWAARLRWSLGGEQWVQEY
jgi:GT2 family glycosyltransferase